MQHYKDVLKIITKSITEANLHTSFYLGLSFRNYIRIFHHFVVKKKMHYLRIERK